MIISKEDEDVEDQDLHGNKENQSLEAVDLTARGQVVDLKHIQHQPKRDENV